MEPLIGEIIMFGGNFAPRSWAFCDGQLLAISQNTALFSILGTTYGGDGRTTFGLPDLRGRVAIHPGNGPGLTSRRLGEKGGREKVTLTTAQMPAHKHVGAVKVSSADSDTSVATANASIGTPGAPVGRVFTGTLGFNSATPNILLNPDSVETANTGGGQSHDNIQPFQAVNYIIALQGIFPSRN
ncbi:MAG: phage tail protein [Flavobacteriaceae bacterium]|nr:phage tail protein [Flavobacteriaceae bacterium]